MFCFQCEQTARQDGQAGCASAKGVCGKDETTADLQDLLIYQLKGLGELSSRLHRRGAADQAADSFILYALFTTLTNVNFDRAVFTRLIAKAATLRDRLRGLLEAAGEPLTGLTAASHFAPAADLAGLLAQANIASVRAGLELVGEDVIGLRALILYGLKGVAAYAHHAEVLGERRDEIYTGIAHA
ncbi:MAG: hydroxylamine reductase, partial [Rhodospirillales bacterium]|nr:hydroxylamine reductase [Rhodospirillales bacterium]